MKHEHIFSQHYRDTKTFGAEKYFEKLSKARLKVKLYNTKFPNLWMKKQMLTDQEGVQEVRNMMGEQLPNRLYSKGDSKWGYIKLAASH